MKKSKFTERQIIQMLKAHEFGRPVMDICREYGISDATFYKWRKQFGGMEYRCATFRKSYVVIYKEDPARVNILAVIHSKRSPEVFETVDEDA